LESAAAFRNFECSRWKYREKHRDSNNNRKHDDEKKHQQSQKGDLDREMKSELAR
jgi:hypothetical protein